MITLILQMTSLFTLSGHNVCLLRVIKKNLEDLMILKCSPDLLNNVKIGQDHLRLIMKSLIMLK